MQTIHLKSLKFQPKSKKKAGEGKSSGIYKFFSSSNIQKKFIDEADFVGPALIFGTGGSASVHFCDEEFSTSTDCFIVKTDNKEIDLKYIYYYLSGNISILEQGFKGAGLKHISKEYLGELQIPLPPLSHQKQIIKKLDNLTNLINLRKLSIDKTEKLTKSIFIEMFGDPMINEKTWEVKKLEELCDKITDGTHNSPKMYSEGYPYISAKHIKPYGIDLSDLEYVKEEDHRKIYNRCNPEYGDVLYIKDGATTGIAQVNLLKYEFSMLSSVALFKTNKNILNGYYLTYFLNNKEIYIKLIRGMGGAAIKRFTLEKLKVFKILTPPISLQNKFASIVEKNEENIKKQKDSLKKLEELYSGIMQESFRV